MKLTLQLLPLAFIALHCSLGVLGVKDSSRPLRRQLKGDDKEDKDKNNDDEFADVLYEQHECIQYSSPTVQRLIGAEYQDHSPECDVENGCSGSATSCCRIHNNLMVCDNSNEYKYQPCVCNENTSVKPQAPSEAPTQAPVDRVLPEPDSCADGGPFYEQLKDLYPDEVFCRSADDCPCCLETWCMCREANEEIGETCVPPTVPTVTSTDP